MHPEHKPELDTPPELLDAVNMEIPIPTDQLEVLEARYKKVMSDIMLTSFDMEGE